MPFPNILSVKVRQKACHGQCLMKGLHWSGDVVADIRLRPRVAQHCGSRGSHVTPNRLGRYSMGDKGKWNGIDVLPCEGPIRASLMVNSRRAAWSEARASYRAHCLRREKPRGHARALSKPDAGGTINPPREPWRVATVSVGTQATMATDWISLQILESGRRGMPLKGASCCSSYCCEPEQSDIVSP